MEVEVKLADESSMASHGGLFDKLTKRARANMHAKFLDAVKPLTSDTILDVGASASPAFMASNYLEWASPKLNISAFGLGEDNPVWRKLYPNIPYTHGTALELPFEDKSFDIVYSHAVIEHVGTFANQIKMISEALRVAKKSVWITTPNRWHPIEFHTVFPLLHWLPKRWYRQILNRAGSEYFSKEENLNLLDRKSLLLASSAGLATQAGTLQKLPDIQIYTSRFLGCTANLLLHIKLQ